MPGSVSVPLSAFGGEAKPASPSPAASASPAPTQKPGAVSIPLDSFGTMQDSRLAPGGSTKVPAAAAEPDMTPPSGSDVTHAVVSNLRPIGGLVGGIAGGVPGAAVGGLIGDAAQHEIEERGYGAPKQTPTEALVSMGASGATEGAKQFGGELVFRALGKLAETGKAFKEGLRGPAPGEAPASFAPSMPTPPASMGGPKSSSSPSFTPTRPVYPGAAMPEHPAVESYKAQSGAFDAAKAQAEASAKGVQSTAAALHEALQGFEPHSGTFGTGEATQGGLRASSDIWHREGGKLYDQAKELTKDIEVPSAPLRDVADKINLENNSTAAHFPKTGAYVPKVQNILDDVTSLGDTVPFQALDGYRKKLNDIPNDRTDTLAADQAKGIVTKLTGAITDAMEKGLGKDTPEAAAWKAARTFWKEGADIFDHSILTKAINSNPEDVLSMIKPGTDTTAASISEAKKLRTGLLEYAQKNGTPAEITEAKATYSKFLRLFTERNMLGSDLTALPGKMAGYRDVLDILYGGIPEGRVVKENLETLSGSIEKSMKDAGAVPDMPKVPKATPSTPLPKPVKVGQGELDAIDSRASVLDAQRKATADAQAASDKTAATAEKERQKNLKLSTQHTVSSMEGKQSQLTQDKIAQRSAAEDQMMGKAKRVQNAIRIAIGGATAAAGATHGVAGVAAGGVAALAEEAVVPLILRSKMATAYFTKGVQDIIAKSSTAPAKSIKVTGYEMNPSTPGWMTNLMKAINIAQDVQDESKPASGSDGPEPFGPLPTRKGTGR